MKGYKCYRCIHGTPKFQEGRSGFHCAIIDDFICVDYVGADDLIKNCKRFVPKGQTTLKEATS